MGKKIAFLHVGPGWAALGDTHESLLRHTEALAGAGLVVPPVTQAQMLHAGLEILRRHKDEGLRRKDVEGSWAAVCRAAEKCGADVVLSNGAFADTTSEQAALLLDGLAAFKVHVVFTTDSDAGHEPGPWTDQVKPHRLHVLAVDATDEDAFVRSLTSLALRVKGRELDKKIAKLRKKRKKVDRRLARAS